MTDIERVEHVLKLRLKYTGRGNYRDGIKIELQRLQFWIVLFCKLELWYADDDYISRFYQECAMDESHRKYERKERKRKGYERLCKRCEQEEKECEALRKSFQEANAESHRAYNVWRKANGKRNKLVWKKTEYKRVNNIK